jgi:mitochondrial fission protein ELM1
MHRVTQEKCAYEGERWAPSFASLARPYVAVLLGGTNGSYKLDLRAVMEFGPQLAAMAKQQNVSLLITPSRRTSEDCLTLLSAHLHDVPHVIWDGSGENPYFGMLGLADAFVVTCDSVNMISETCSTGKPVYVIKLAGHSDKFESFYKSLIETGRIRFFQGVLDHWSYEPLSEISRVAELIHKRFMEKKQAQSAVE